MTDVKVMIRNMPKYERDPNNNKMWRAFWPDKKLEESKIEVVLVPKHGDDDFLFYFAQALNGIKLSAIKKCSTDKCNNWYVQFGKKDRFYCSDRCRAKEYNRKARQRIKEEGGAAYAAYKNEGKKRRNLNYRKNMEKKLPGAKVGKKLK